jgi:hypothetical protein
MTRGSFCDRKHQIRYINNFTFVTGVALDGFPIYGPYASDKGDEPLTKDDLDICHGRMVDGKYRYHLTFDFPYVLGCYWGSSARDNANGVSYVCDLEQGTGKEGRGWELKVSDNSMTDHFLYKLFV